MMATQVGGAVRVAKDVPISLAEWKATVVYWRERATVNLLTGAAHHGKAKDMEVRDGEEGH